MVYYCIEYLGCKKQGVLGWEIHLGKVLENIILPPRNGWIEGILGFRLHCIIGQ